MFDHHSAGVPSPSTSLTGRPAPSPVQLGRAVRGRSRGSRRKSPCGRIGRPWQTVSRGVSAQGSGGLEGSKEREGSGDAAQGAEAGSQAPAGNVLNEAERERIRSEEIHSAKEQRCREDVRREVRREARGSTTLARVVAMLKLEPGISDEIASDLDGTKQRLVVVAVTTASCGGARG